MGICSSEHQISYSHRMFNTVMEQDYFDEFVRANNSFAHTNKGGTNLVMGYLFHAETVDLDVLRELLDRSTFDINYANNGGFTVLMYAACRDNCDFGVFRLLLDRGANMNKKPNVKFSAQESNCIVS